MAQQTYILTQLNNQYVELDGLIDATTQGQNPPTYINNATGTLAVKDSTGTPVVIGAASAVSVATSYVSGSNGNYRALITSAFNPPLSQGYTIVVDLTTPGGIVAHFELAAEVRVRKG